MLAMIKIPMMWVMLYAIVTSSILLSFLGPALSPHLETLSLTPTAMGAMFALSTGVYTVTAPLWGFLIDKFRCADYFIFGGAIAAIPAMLLIGPSPLTGISKGAFPIGFGLAILGLTMGSLGIPVFQKCIDIVKKHGFEDNSQTYGGVSGMFSTAMALGGFLGPSLGGACVDLIGLPWTATALSGALAVFVVSLLLSYTAVGVHRRNFKKRQVKPESV
uniref:MFS domain-containing protein n=1 Tax=Steinernema glaseri TaxID=37863 RepID=A0A1I8ASK5_9BILA